jgi:two-component system osmolarity sensor histidine kinase EnvZ
MSLWPRTLFSRNLLLMVLLILLAQLVSAGLFRELVMRPRLQLTADATVRQFEALEAGLQSLTPPQRQQFVERFNDRANAAPPTSAGHRLSPLERAYLHMVTERLASRGSQITWRHDAADSRTLTLTMEGQSYQLNFPSPLPPRAFPWGWAVGTAVSCLLAGLGAWLIQRRINRPLNELVQAAQALGRGERPPALCEDGPSEIATVAHGFNEMVAALAHNERERALMLAGLSHDLRTPLAKMRLATEMLSGRGDADLLGSLNRNVEAMDHLLNQFLDFTRASQAGNWDQESPTTTDLNALVSDALALCAPVPFRRWRCAHRPCAA